MDECYYEGATTITEMVTTIIEVVTTFGHKVKKPVWSIDRPLIDV